MASVRVDVLQSGKRRYRVRVRRLGVLRTGSFGRKAEAERFAFREEERILLTGRDSFANAKARTFAELVTRYEERILRNKGKATQRNQRGQLEVWRQLFAGLTLDQVTPPIIAEAKYTLQDMGFSSATVNRYLAVLSHLFARAVKEWQWCPTNPCRDVDRLAEPPGRVRYLSDGERYRLLLMCKASRCRFLYPVAVLSLSTGMRKGEAVGLTWDRVDLERGRVYLTKTKNKAARSLPLLGEALGIMRKLNEERDPIMSCCFPSAEADRPVDFRSAWRLAVKRARLDDFRFHDLRHSAASYLAMQGATLMEIADVLGHKTLNMVKRYSHLTENHTTQVVQRMNAKYLPEKGASHAGSR